MDRRLVLPVKMLLFFFHATNTIILSYLPLYLEYKNLTKSEIGIVLAIGPLSAIFAQPFWGYLSDKFKTVKYIIQICIVGLLLTSFLFFRMDTLITIILVGAVFYFFTSPIAGLGDSLAQRYANNTKISFGSIRMWGSVGFAFSTLIVGEVLTRIGVQHIAWPYIAFGTFALLVSIKLKDANYDTTPVKIADLKKIFQNTSFLWFLFLMLFLSITHRASDSYISLYITELGGSERLVGISWFVGVISEAAVFALASFWFRKYQALTFVIIAGFVYSIRWFLYSYATEPIEIILFQIFHGLAYGTFYVAAFSYITKLIPAFLQSTGHLIFFAMFFGVSGIVGSLIGGTILDNFNGGALYFLLGIISLSGTIFLVFRFLFLTKKQFRY